MWEGRKKESEKRLESCVPNKARLVVLFVIDWVTSILSIYGTVAPRPSTGPGHR